MAPSSPSLLLHPIRALHQIRRDELPQALLMFAYFLVVITTFWVLKPLKKSLFITYYDAPGLDLLGWHLAAAQAELLAKVANVGVAYVAVITFSWLATHYRRQQLTVIFSGFFGLTFAVFAVALPHAGAFGVWAFYLLGDLFNSLMIVTFFAFLNDIVTSDAAKRTYGLVGLGGVVGGVLGSTMVVGLSKALSISAWLGACTIGMGFVAALGLAVGRLHVRRTTGEAQAQGVLGAAGAGASAADRSSPMFEGLQLVLRSNYLLSIVAIVGIYEMVSTILDFQFSATMAHYLDGPAIGQAIGIAFAVMNWTALFVQLVLTSFIMRRHGVAVALAILPMALLLGAASFFVAPVLLVGSLIPALDGGLQYSINQSAKESLYVPTSPDEKYKAKSFIDMFVQRFAKGLAIGLSLVLSAFVSDFSGVRWLSLVSIPLIVAWLFAARYAGLSFERVVSGGAPPPTAPEPDPIPVLVEVTRA